MRLRPFFKISSAKHGIPASPAAGRGSLGGSLRQGRRAWLVWFAWRVGSFSYFCAIKFDEMDLLTIKTTRKWKDYLCYWCPFSQWCRQAWVPRLRKLQSPWFRDGPRSAIRVPTQLILRRPLGTLSQCRATSSGRSGGRPLTRTDAGEVAPRSSTPGMATNTSRTGRCLS